MPPFALCRANGTGVLTNSTATFTAAVLGTPTTGMGLAVVIGDG